MKYLIPILFFMIALTSCSQEENAEESSSTENSESHEINPLFYL